MRFACWITKATGTHSECVILTACPRQQRLSGHASMLTLCLHCPSCSAYHRLALAPQPSGCSGYFLRSSSARSVKRVTRLHLVSRLKMCDALTLCCLYTVFCFLRIFNNALSALAWTSRCDCDTCKAGEKCQSQLKRWQTYFLVKLFDS